MMLAVILFVVACLGLYVVEHVLYAGAVGTVFIYVSIYPPVFFVLYLVFGNRPLKRELSEEQKQVRSSAGYMALAVVTVFTYYYVIFTQRTRLSSWQLLALVTALVVIAIMHKLRGENKGANFIADAVSIAYFLIILVTTLFLLIAQPYTVTAAREKLAENGYPNVVYETHYPIVTDNPDDEEPTEETRAEAASAEEIATPIDKAGHYGIYAFLDLTSNEYVYVDVLSGEIILGS